MSAIDEIKQKIDIAEIIGQYTTLKKAGRNLTALCPFHSEKHPSFFVYPEQQSWHCFGACNTGGDVFAFIMKKEGLDFGEALRLLANRAGVILPERPGLAERKEEKEEFFKANEAAAMYYHNLLLNSPAAAKAKSYVEKRGLTPKTIGEFQLGYSPDSYDALKQYMLEKGHSEKTLITAGLLYQDENGRSSDRFRGKLMIPIHDIKGRVTGFGARVLDDSEPKYKNSPQSPTFDKSGTLYGIDHAAAAIRKLDRAIIMEGYMDVIMAHQRGVSNAVASMGTAITESQVNILKKLSKNLILSLDADAAGEEAMLRMVGYENLLSAEMRVVLLPEGRDPDEVIGEDIGLWQELVDRAIPLTDFLFEKTTAGLDLTTAGGKSKAVDGLLPVVTEISDPIRQAHYLQKLAGLVQVDMNTIKVSMSRIKRPGGRTARREGQAVPVKQRRITASSNREEYLLAMLLQNPELKIDLGEISSECFQNTENREIFNAWKESGDVVKFTERVDPAIREHVEAIMNKILPGAGNNIEQRCVDCACELKKTYLKSLAARIAETGEVRIEIPEQLKELDARKSQKRNPSLKERIRR